MDTILGATTIDEMRALVELATMVDEGVMEGTTYHEAFHIALRSLMPRSDVDRLLKFFKGNEEDAANAFAEHIKMKGMDSKLPKWLFNLFENLRKYLSRFKAAMNTDGFSNPADFFDAIYLGKYHPQFGPQMTYGQSPMTALAYEGEVEDFESKLITTIVKNVRTMPSKLDSVKKWLGKQNIKPEELKWMGVDAFLEEQRLKGERDKNGKIFFTNKKLKSMRRF